jgi:membrane protein implicated in regulation of membrane protease activity
MARAIEIIAVIVIILLIVGVVTMPWPANLILGGIATVSAITAVISSKWAKKKEHDGEQNDSTDR